jgi:hypothetical protein
MRGSRPKQRRSCAMMGLRELPGIEPGAKMVVSWGNAKLNYAKPRETTRNDLRIRRRC